MRWVIVAINFFSLFLPDTNTILALTIYFFKGLIPLILLGREINSNPFLTQTRNLGSNQLFLLVGINLFLHKTLEKWKKENHQSPQGCECFFPVYFIFCVIQFWKSKF